jgi:hypothetical protein
MFPTYFQLGFEHITDVNGYDHILFLIALCAAYRFSDWKSILVLITAFTVGHSLTLALAVLHIITVNSDWVEFLIPLTIFITAGTNLYQARKDPSLTRPRLRREGNLPILGYVFALGFGLIHGMGFSNFLRSLLGEELLLPLFSFNVGLEVGQLIIVAVIFTVQWAAVRFMQLQLRWWNLLLSLIAAGVAVVLMAERLPF